MPTPHARDIYGLTVLKNSHPAIRKIKRESVATAIHGNKFWQSSTILIDYLNAEPPKHHWRILEIGCGWGISGIYCAKNFQSTVTALDADAAVFPYLNYHAELNGVTITTLKRRYEKVTLAMLAEFDMVIGSDICFWDEMAPVLFNLVRRCYRAGVKRVVMTDPGREPFTQMAERCVETFAARYEGWSVPHPYNNEGVVLDIS